MLDQMHHEHMRISLDRYLSTTFNVIRVLDIIEEIYPPLFQRIGDTISVPDSNYEIKVTNLNLKRIPGIQKGWMNIQLTPLQVNAQSVELTTLTHVAHVVAHYIEGVLKHGRDTTERLFRSKDHCLKAQYFYDPETDIRYVQIDTFVICIQGKKDPSNDIPSKAIYNYISSELINDAIDDVQVTTINGKVVLYKLDETSKNIVFQHSTNLRPRDMIREFDYN